MEQQQQYPFFEPRALDPPFCLTDHTTFEVGTFISFNKSDSSAAYSRIVKSTYGVQSLSAILFINT